MHTIKLERSRVLGPALVGLLCALGCSGSSTPESEQLPAMGQAGSTPVASAGTAGARTGGGEPALPPMGGASAAGGGGAAGGGDSGGMAGMAPTETAGAGGGANADPNDPYAPAPREIQIDPARGAQAIGFRAEDADPMAQSFHGGEQRAEFDANAEVVRAKLVIGLHGIGNGPGPGGALSFAVNRGFHVIAVDYDNDQSGGPQGAGYLEIWSGEDFSPDIDVQPVNSVRHRIESGLAYLDGVDPGADWGYFLNEDGTVRFSDVIAFGYSFGGQTGAAATKLDALDRVIATSAPGIDADAAWLEMPAITPGERGWALFDMSDGGERKTAAAQALGWPGEPVNVGQVAPPYDGSHILLLDGGHSEFCSRPEFDEVCDFAFGVIE